MCCQVMQAVQTDNSSGISQIQKYLCGDAAQCELTILYISLLRGHFSEQ